MRQQLERLACASAGCSSPLYGERPFVGQMAKAG